MKIKIRQSTILIDKDDWLPLSQLNWSVGKYAKLNKVKS